MSDTFARKIAMLQDAERQKQLTSQESQSEDLAKLLPVKEEHERVLQVIARNLNIVARQMPGLLRVRWSRNILGSGYSQHGPVLLFHQTDTHDQRLRLDYALEIDAAPELKDLKGYVPLNYQPPPDTQVEVVGLARASAIGVGRPARWTWRMTAPLGELVLDPLAEVSDKEFVKARLYQSQIDALEKVKELLDEDKLAQMVFDFIPEYLR